MTKTLPTYAVVDAMENNIVFAFYKFIKAEYALLKNIREWKQLGLTSARLAAVLQLPTTLNVDGIAIDELTPTQFLFRAIVLAAQKEARDATA